MRLCLFIVNGYYWLSAAQYSNFVDKLHKTCDDGRTLHRGSQMSIIGFLLQRLSLKNNNHECTKLSDAYQAITSSSAKAGVTPPA